MIFLSTLNIFQATPASMVNLMKKLETVDDEAANISAEANQALQPKPSKLQPRRKEAEIEASIIVEKRGEEAQPQPQVFSGKNKSSFEDDDTASIKKAAVLALSARTF